MVKIKILKSIQVNGIYNICCFSGFSKQFTDWLIKDTIYEFADIWRYKNNLSDLIINNDRSGFLHPDRILDIPNDCFEEIK